MRFRFESWGDPTEAPVWLNSLENARHASHPREIWWDVKWTFRFYWENYGRRRAMRLVPRGVKKWAVVEAAVKADWNGHPTEVTYMQMVDVFDPAEKRKKKAGPFDKVTAG